MSVEREPRPARRARTEAFRQLVELRGGRLRLTRANYFDADDKGLTRQAIDQAIADLVKEGIAKVTAEDAVVVVTLVDRRGSK